MNILLTGAAGNVGLETLKALLDEKCNITVLELNNRKTRKKLNKYRNKVNIVYGSINDEELMRKLLENKDVVIHLAAIIPPLADKNPELTRKVNYEGTRNIIDRIKEQKNKPFLIFSSSISVYGDRVKNYNIKVNDPLIPSVGDYYAEVKIMTEEMIRNSGVQYTIYRLTGIMGYPALDALMFHMPLNTKIEFASNRDVGYAFANSINHLKELNEKTFNLGGGIKFRTTYEEFIKRMFDIYGLDYKYINKRAFATQNFHCGYYEDTDKLNNILHFQRDTLDSYFDKVDKETNKFVKFLTKLFSKPVIFFLNKTSEPLKALKNSNINLIKRFFKK
jgi:nucleoside-diphosphate-sugar epimerase